MKKLLIVTLSLLLVSTPSCVTYEKCTEKYGTGQEKPKVDANLDAELPGNENSLGFSKDDLENMPVGSTKTKPGTAPGKSAFENPVNTSLTRTGANSWDCTGKTETKTIPITIPCDCPPVNNFRPDPVITLETPVWNWLLIGFLGFGIAVQSFRVWRYNRKYAADDKKWRVAFDDWKQTFADYKSERDKPSMPTMQDNGLPS